MDLLSGPALGALAALGSAVTWTFISLLVRTLSATFDSIRLNALRATLGGLLLLLSVLALDRGAGLARLSARTFALLVVSNVVAIVVGDTLFFESTRHVGLARAMTVSMSYPLITAVFAVALLGETITGRVATGIGLTLGGLVLIVTARETAPPESPHQAWKGLGLAALAALAWAVAVIVLKPPLRELDAATAQAIRLPMAGFILLASPWARGAVARFRQAGRTAQLRVIWLAGLTAASSLMFVAGLKHASAAVATALASTAPLFAIPVGLLFLGERLQVRAVLGAILTVGGIALLT